MAFGKDESNIHLGCEPCHVIGSLSIKASTSLDRFVASYADDHRNGLNRWCHLVGIHSLILATYLTANWLMTLIFPSIPWLILILPILVCGYYLWLIEDRLIDHDLSTYVLFHFVFFCRAGWPLCLLGLVPSVM